MLKWIALFVFSTLPAYATQTDSSRQIDREAAAVDAQAIEWRRDIHAHPELGFQETRTADLVAKHLRSLGLEVETGIGHTGVVGILHGALPGKTVALRSELDALPVTEVSSVPFASAVRVEYHGQQTGVMHACGHDVHMAVLMGAATVLAKMRAQLHGNVVFVFQPDEEQTASPVEQGGAQAMLAAGLFAKSKPEAIFALHVTNQYPVGEMHLATGAAKAGDDRLDIVVNGVQVHAAKPWAGVDPIVVASQIVLGLQTVISRDVDPTADPVVLSIGMIQGGVRPNIIPDTVTLSGDLRWFTEHGRTTVREKVERMAQGTASAAGATANVKFAALMPPITNDAGLANRMRPTLSDLGVKPGGPSTTSDDFAYLLSDVPGLYLYLGGTPKGVDPATTAANHSPKFFVDEGAIQQGIRLMSRLAFDYLAR